jgi:hypothetical protein
MPAWVGDRLGAAMGRIDAAGARIGAFLSAPNDQSHRRPRVCWGTASGRVGSLVQATTSAETNCRQVRQAGAAPRDSAWSQRRQVTRVGARRATDRSVTQRYPALPTDRRADAGRHRLSDGIVDVLGPDEAGRDARVQYRSIVSVPTAIAPAWCQALQRPQPGVSRRARYYEGVNDGPEVARLMTVCAVQCEATPRTALRARALGRSAGPSPLSARVTALRWYVRSLRGTHSRFIAVPKARPVPPGPETPAFPRRRTLGSPLTGRVRQANGLWKADQGISERHLTPSRRRR